MLDKYVKTAISNIRELKRVPKDSRIPLAESLSDKLNNIFYNVEQVTKWLIRTNDGSLAKPCLSLCLPPSDLEQRIKLVNSKLGEKKYKGSDKACVFFVTAFDLCNAIMSFPNGSAAGPDKIVPKIFQRFC